jgi:hypothetical protein
MAKAANASTHTMPMYPYRSLPLQVYYQQPSNQATSSSAAAHLSASQHSHVLQVCLSVLSKAGRLHRAHLEATAQLVKTRHTTQRRST